MSENEKQSRIGAIWKDKGSKRLILFVGAAVVGVGGYLMLGGGSVHEETSKVKSAPVLNSTQGGVPVSQQYASNLQQADVQRANEAKKIPGMGAMPTIVATSTGSSLPSTLVDTDEHGKEDPIERPVPKAEDMKPEPPKPAAAAAAAPLPAQQQQQGAQVPRGPAYDPNLVAAMQKQMQGIVKTTTEFQPAMTTYLWAPQQQVGVQQGVAQNVASGYTGVQDASASGKAGVAQSGVQSAAQVAAPSGAQAVKKFQSPVAGTILYSRLVGRVNSDVPGPVVAEVLQGPFAGARLLGEFQTTEEGVVIKFSTMTVPYTDSGEAKSEVVAIHAVAVDTSHLGDALATDIDHHLLSKVGFAFATAFIQGFGQAIGTSGTTTTTAATGQTTTSNPTLSMRQQLLMAGGTASGSAGTALNKIYGDRKTTVTVEADTPFGLLFIGNGN